MPTQPDHFQGPTPGARAFYALNELFDDLEHLTPHEVNLLLSEIHGRVQDGNRANAIHAMLRAYQTEKQR